MKLRVIVAVILAGPGLGHAAAVAPQELAAALRAAPDIQHGEQLFAACASCHTANGGGGSDGNVPGIAGQHRAVIIKQLVDFRRSRRLDVRMERYSSDHVLKDYQDIADVAGYVSALPMQSWPQVGQLPESGAAAQLYRHSCAGCHGQQAEGSDTQLIPRMAGQNASYLMRQLQYAIEQRRPSLARDHAVLLEKWSYADLQRVASYLATLQP